MTLALLLSTLILVALYAHVSNNVDKYAASGNVVSRIIVLVSGLAMGGFGAFVFIQNVEEPSWAFGSGFVLGPMFAVASTIYVVVALFFPLQQVRGLLRYSFRHKLHDDIRG